MKARQKPLTRLGSTAMSWHPAKMSMSCELNEVVCLNRHRIASKNNPGNRMHLRSTRLEPLSQSPEALLPICHSFDCSDRGWLKSVVCSVDIRGRHISGSRKGILHHTQGEWQTVIEEMLWPRTIMISNLQHSNSSQSWTWSQSMGLQLWPFFSQFSTIHAYM